MPTKPSKIYAELLDPKALKQYNSAMAQSYTIQGALMPDAHAGYTLPIGAVIATQDTVVPAWVGYDIGCGMCALPTTFSADIVRENAEIIFKEIYKQIPVGFNHNQTDSVWAEEAKYPRTPITDEIFKRNGLKQLGSLGGGNHFIEIGVDSCNIVWAIIHSGSRGIGHAVATHYMKLASPDGHAREGHWGFNTHTQEGKDYIMDLNFCLTFALENRRNMMLRVEHILKRISKTPFDRGMWEHLINRNHNHAEESTNGVWVHRKGATHAEAGMYGVIPGNMRDGSFIVRGKGNPESLCSSSHGAGRVLGRKEAQNTLKLNDFVEEMKAVVAKVDETTLDESPFAYKNIFDVMEQQKDLVEIITHVIPIINIKG